MKKQKTLERIAKVRSILEVMEEEVDDIFDGRRKKGTEKFVPSRTRSESIGS